MKISQMKKDELFEGFYLIKSAELRKTRAGKDYIAFTFQDDSGEISGNLWEQLEAVLEYVIENVTNDSFKLIDPGNSNNNLMDSLESWDKSNLANAFQNLLNRVDDNSNNLELYFPKNEKFADEQDTKGYGLKSSGLLISTPSTPQRFG